MEKKQLALKLPQWQSRQSSLATPPTLGRNTSRELLDLRSFPKMYQKTVSITTTPRPRGQLQRQSSARWAGTRGGACCCPSNSWGTRGERSCGGIYHRSPSARKGPGEARDQPRRRPQRGGGQAHELPSLRQLSFLTVKYAEVEITHALRLGVGLKRARTRDACAF